MRNRTARLGRAVTLTLVVWTLGTLTPRAATPPARIVSTSPSITETLFALGLGDRVVGVSQYCRFPPQAATLPKVGTFLKPNAELIAGLRPDLVIVHQVADGVDRRLAALRIPYVVVERGALTSVFSSIRHIASAAGVPARGDALVADLERKLEAVRGRAETPRPRVLFVVGRRPGTLADLVAVGPGSYLDDLIGIAGGVNVTAIAGQPEYPRLSMETVLRLNPDVIVDTVNMGDTDAAFTAHRRADDGLWSRYGTLTAVQTGRVFSATTDALVVPGPRVVEAAEWIAALLHRRP
ncbi:MAG TPA: helical backbone metal receptor [Vicinamibacterales bacterium]|nr:helical backbone metal receptor [Vicinamibacterales bacterium]